METLDELALRHRTDKSSAAHDVASIYDTYLERWRGRPVTVLEIGVLDGASLRMWRDYFAEGCVVGLDAREVARGAEEPGLRVVIGDQRDFRVLDAVVAETGPIDLVVDDGGHRAADQVGTLTYLWPHLRPGGLYVVEDTHTSYLDDWGMHWRRPGTTMEFLKGLADDLHAARDLGNRWHTNAVALLGIESIHFYRETCLLRKATASPSGRAPGRPVGDPLAPV